MSDLWLDPKLMLRPLTQTSSQNFWSSLHVQTSGPEMICCMLLTRCLVVIVIVMIICFWHRSFLCLCARLFVRSFICACICLCMHLFVCSCSRALTIPSEVQTVQDVICPLINYASISDHSSGPIFLDHLKLRLDLLPLGFVIKPTAYQ